MASVKADGTKLPFFIIVKGKTEITEKNLGDISYNMSVKSNNGWKTESTFVQYLKFLRSETRVNN